MLNPALLAAARRRQDELGSVENRLSSARARYVRAVLNLHLAGATLREIAGALNISHQRVHQIVTKESRTIQAGLRRRSSSVSCALCDAPEGPRRLLLHGPRHCVCSECVVILGSIAQCRSTTHPVLGYVQFVSGGGADLLCILCLQSEPGVDMVAVQDGAAICTGCLGLATHICQEEIR